MQVSDTLLSAILAMDSYNRGKGAGFGQGGDGLGSESGTKIGIATILDVPLPQGWEAAGFYAVAYQLADGRKVISFRGTDNLDMADPSNDIQNGWVMGAGNENTAQAALAIQFYEQVTGQSLGDGPAENTIVTGHSLGGGLAGLISSLSGTRGFGFDHMPFGITAEKIAASRGLAATWENFTGISTENEILQFVRDAAAQATLAQILDLLPNDFNLTLAKWLGVPLDPSSPASSLVLIGARTAELEGLIENRTILKNFAGVFSGLTSFRPDTQLHMQDMLVQLQFAVEYGHTAWQPAGLLLWNAYFSSDVAVAAGFNSLTTNDIKATQLLGRAIAYTALGEGKLPYGNIAIHAMFNDADRTGGFLQFIEGALLDGYVDLDSVRIRVEEIRKILETVVTFAGHSALSAQEFIKSGLATIDTVDGVRENVGILRFSDDYSVMTMDFSSALWGVSKAESLNFIPGYVLELSRADEMLSRSDILDAMIIKGIATADIQRFHISSLVGENYYLNDTLFTDDKSYGIFVSPDSSSGYQYVTGTEQSDLIISGNGKAGRAFNSGGGNDILIGGSAADNLVAGSGDDLVRGGGGDDAIQNDLGNDIVDGGSGYDTVYYTNSYTTYKLTVISSVTGSIKSSSVSDAGTDMLSNIEVIVFTDGAYRWGEGFIRGRYIPGTAGNDSIGGTNGIDYIDAGAGDDFIYDVYGPSTTIYGGSGNDRIRIMSFFDNKTFITSGVIDGGANYDIFEVTLADPLNWATDAYYLYNFTVRNVEELITWDAGVYGTVGQFEMFTNIRLTDGTPPGKDDRIRLSLVDKGISDLRSELGAQSAQISASDFGNTIYAGAGAADLWGGVGKDILYGGIGNDSLTGNGNADFLDGGAGKNHLKGGEGNDTYVVNSTADTVDESGWESSGTDTVKTAMSYSLVTSSKLIGDLENLILTGGSNINGTGNGLANVITGNGGNNILDGKGGADRLVGGMGNDIYIVDNINDVIVEAAGSGTDRVQSSANATLSANVEELTLSGISGISGTGNALNNVITGNSGNNRIDGGAGNDRLVGGKGNDTYIVDSTKDIVVESASGGTDLVQASVSVTLAANIENLLLTGAREAFGTGNALNNVITGNSGNNRLDGGAGGDKLSGGKGDDTYIVDSSKDLVIEGANAGIDTVQATVTVTLGANVEKLILTGTGLINGSGNGLANSVIGNASANVLNGGLGNDLLKGGNGADSFVFNSALNASLNVDHMLDFSAKDDVIRLENAIFASLSKTGLLSQTAFYAGASGKAHDKDDRIVYETDTGKLYYDKDGTGSASSILFAVLDTRPAVTYHDFFVV